MLYVRAHLNIFLTRHWGLMPVNPNYSGGRDQEDSSSKPAQANSSKDPVSKIPITKRTGGVAQCEGPEFKLQY
jgi:hypothetical protein